jgi:hypothetical protein
LETAPPGLIRQVSPKPPETEELEPQVRKLLTSSDKSYTVFHENGCDGLFMGQLGYLKSDDE